MKMDPFSREFVGHGVTVTGARNPLYLGLKGSVIDETKNMIVIRTEAGDRMVPKRGNRFNIEFAPESAEVEGNIILYTVEDRIRNASKITRLAKRMRH